MDQDLTRYRSVVATGASVDRSAKFSFVPTTRVIDLLATQHWLPAKVSEKAARIESHRGFQQHLIRFRREEDVNQMAVVGEMIPEIILKNAHDGTASFEIMAGLFRFVCGNGMIVADSMFARHRIKHIGFQNENVIDAVFNVVETTPKIMGRVDEFKQVVLNKPEQLAFAESALIAKYGDSEKSNKYDLESLVYPSRSADRINAIGIESRNSLWNTFNILQERLVEKGGRFAKSEKNPYRKMKARGIKSVSENVRVNQALWALTEKMAELKA
jgi:hypothetical protein